MGGITLGKNKSKKEDLEWVSPRILAFHHLSRAERKIKTVRVVLKQKPRKENVLEKKEWSTWMYC